MYLVGLTPQSRQNCREVALAARNTLAGWDSIYGELIICQMRAPDRRVLGIIADVSAATLPSLCSALTMFLKLGFVSARNGVELQLDLSSAGRQSAWFNSFAGRRIWQSRGEPADIPIQLREEF